MNQELNYLIARLKANDSTVTSIKLTSNNIGDLGAIALIDALKTNTTLTFDNNNIGDEGAIALAEVLRSNKTLTSIKLTSNNIGDKGAIALAEALKENTTLTSINLTSNNIGDKGAIALAEALKENITVTSIELFVNKITHDVLDNIEIAIDDNKRIKEQQLTEDHKIAVAMGLHKRLGAKSFIKTIDVDILKIVVKSSEPSRSPQVRQTIEALLESNTERSI